MKSVKKILAIVLTFAMVVTVGSAAFTAGVFAADEYEYITEDFSTDFLGDTLTNGDTAYGSDGTTWTFNVGGTSGTATGGTAYIEDGKLVLTGPNVTANNGTWFGAIVGETDWINYVVEADLTLSQLDNANVPAQANGTAGVEVLGQSAGQVGHGMMALALFPEFTKVSGNTKLTSGTTFKDHSKIQKNAARNKTGTGTAAYTPSGNINGMSGDYDGHVRIEVMEDADIAVTYTNYNDNAVYSYSISGISGITGNITFLAYPGTKLTVDNVDITHTKSAAASEPVPDIELGRGYTLNGKGNQLLFGDYFYDYDSFSAAVGTGSNPLAYGDGKLAATATQSGNTLFYGLSDNYSAMTNYTISADIVSCLNAGFTDTRIGVIAYGKYEFTLYGTKIRLYRRSATAKELMFNNTDGAAFTNYFSNYTAGRKVTISLHVSTVGSTVYLKGYAVYNGVCKLLCDITDTDGEVLSGAPGLMISKKDAAAYFTGVQIFTDVTEADSSVLYRDTFTGIEGYGAALSTYTGTNANSVLYKPNNLLINRTTGQQTSLFNGITNAANLTNYTVSADFSFIEDTATLSGISAYCDTSGKGYEFAVYKNSFRVYDRNTAKYLLDWTTIASLFPGYTIGDTINLAMTVVTNGDGSVTIFCTAATGGVTKAVLYCNETGSRQRGIPGIRGGTSSGVAIDSTVDNMLVQTCGSDINDDIFSLCGFVQDPILNIGADSSSRNVNWQTALDMECVFEYAEKADMVNNEFPTAPGSYTALTETKYQSESGWISHKVTITGLSTNTDYVYRIRSGSAVSDLFYFSTYNASNGYSFSFMGDPQVGRIEEDVEQWEDVLDVLQDNYTVDFMLSLGDEVHASTYGNVHGATYGHWYDGFVADNLTGLTTATLIGNHDKSSVYSDYFNLPNVSDSYGITDAGSDYWFVYGNTLFMILNSNNPSIAEHAAFMEEAIDANPDVVWKVAALHHCIYSVSSHYDWDDVLALREGLVPVFNDLDVDVVLLGHDHCYTRTYMMNGFEPDTSHGVQSSVTDPTGILYITANSASGSKYNGIRSYSEPYAAVIDQSSRQTFAVVDVADDHFAINTYYMDNPTTPMDSITIYKTVTPEPEPELKIASASVTLQTNLTVNYKVDASLFTGGGAVYSDPYMVFEMDGVNTTVTDYTVSGGRYVFSFRNVSPDRMNTVINATLYATKSGEPVSCSKSYSIGEYCYNLLDEYSDDQYAELRTLIVDMLKYGAMSQAYTGYNSSNPVTADLTPAQLAWGTASAPVAVSVFDTSYATVANPAATWKSAGIRLSDSITMRFGLQAEDITGLTVKCVCGSDVWTVPASEFIAKSGYEDNYYVYFDQLHAGRMEETLYVTVYNGETPVSNTLAYSVASYVYEKQSSGDPNLVNLVNAMLNYGKAAYAYAN